MKTNIYFMVCCLLLASTTTLAQKKGRRYVFQPTTRNEGKAFVVDASFMEVYYAMNADDIKNDSSYLDYQCLEIGRKYVKYSSEFMKESAVKRGAWMQEHPNAQSIPFFFPQTKLGIWSEYQYTDIFIHNDTLTEYSTMPSALEKENAYHKEEYPKQQWKILPDTATICHILCQKAVCDFSGRHYVAWFANGIPLRYGPWKFGGLPGLILKMEDSKGQYSFECVKIEKSQKEIISHEYTGYRERKRSDILKLQRMINEDYLKMIRYTSMRTGEVVSNYVPYDPMELE